MTTWKAMSFNVRVGGEARFEQILSLIALQQPDLLVLQECLDWDRPDENQRLSRVTSALDLPPDARHVHLGLAHPSPRPTGGRRYPLAVFSRLPIASVHDHADPHFITHCLVELEIDLPALGRTTIFCAHFDSQGEDLRMIEVGYLRSLLATASVSDDHALLLGDLNAISPRDPYPADLALRLRKTGSDKYGHPPRFDVITELESLAWIDTLRAVPDTADPDRSTPWATAVRTRAGIRMEFRNDYIFASPRLAARLQSARVVDGQGASDHEPITATFDLDPI